MEHGKRRASARPVAGITAKLIMHNFIHKSALADTLGVSIRTLENWCIHRNFPKARHLSDSRLVFFCVSEVEAWLEKALDSELPK